METVETVETPATDAPVAYQRVYRPGLFAAFPLRRRRATVVTQPVATQTVVEAPKRDVRAAYERGRRDGVVRRRRRGFPLVGFLVLLVALAGGTMMYLAAENGSFAAGGRSVDQALGQASAPARQAVDNTGDALEHAGQSLKNAAGGPQQPAQP